MNKTAIFYYCYNKNVCTKNILGYLWPCYKKSISSQPHGNKKKTYKVGWAQRRKHVTYLTMHIKVRLTSGEWKPVTLFVN